MGAGYRLCRYARPSPYWLKPIRALATLLPPRGAIRSAVALFRPAGLNTGFFGFALAIGGMAYESMAFGFYRVFCDSARQNDNEEITLP